MLREMEPPRTRSWEMFYEFAYGVVQRAPSGSVMT